MTLRKRAARAVVAVLSFGVPASAQVVDGSPAYYGNLSFGGVDTLGIDPGQVHTWDVGIRAGEFVQVRLRSSDPARIDIRDPGGAPQEPLGGWVGGMSHWAMIYGEGLGVWTIQIRNEGIRAFEYELELTMRAPWPEAGNDRELPITMMELAHASAQRGDWVRAEAQFAAGQASGHALLGADPERDEYWRGWAEAHRFAMHSFFRESSAVLATQSRRSWLLGDRGQAIEQLERAVRFNERWAASSLGDERTRAAIFGEGNDLVHTLVGYLLALGEVEEAFEQAERGRARAQLEQISDGDIYVRDVGLETTRDSLGSHRLALLERMSWLQEGSNGSDSEMSAARDSLAEIDRRFNEVYARLRTTSMRRARLVRSPVPLDELQRSVVPADGAMIFYQLGQGRSYLFVIPPSGESIEGYVLPGPVEAGMLPDIAGASNSMAFSDLAEELHRAWRILVPEPVWSRIAAASEVVIVPDRDLHYIPFEALVVSPGAAPEDTRFWIDEGPPLRYAMSATTLYEMQLRAAFGPDRPGPGSLLSVAAPAYPTGLGDAFPALPGTRFEAAQVQQALAATPVEVTVLSDASATESAVRASLSEVTYAHFATHGLVRGHWDGLFSSLVLAATDVGGDPSNDGFLHLHEIYGLDLAGLELAILSACSTNVGEEWGSGVFALSGGFLSAGANRTITSQWNVDDQSTSILIGRFFGRFAEEGGVTGMPVSGMLRDAKLALRHDPAYGHPFFWAPFIVSGIR